MKRLEKILPKAYESKFWLWVLNKGLGRVIPFNAPHQFKIIHIDKNTISVHIPFIRRNLNHLNGIHACALATASEYACGFLLISRLSPSKYRLIMRNLSIDFVKQGREELFVNFSLTDDRINVIKKKLESSPQCLELLEVEVKDAKGNLISIAKLEWQLKDWKKL
jgi:acyl-coenzyme A thioesterase PaaI-like protein